MHLLTIKRKLFISYVYDVGYEGNPYLDAMRAFADQVGDPVVAVCAAIEAELADLEDAD